MLICCRANPVLKKDRRGTGPIRFGSVHISGSPTATATGTTTTSTATTTNQQEPQETRTITTTTAAKDRKNNKKTTIVCVILVVKCCKYRAKRQVEVPKCKIQRPCSKIPQIPRKTRNPMSKTVETHGNTSQNERWNIQCVASSKENRDKRKPKKSPKLQRVPETFCKVMHV